MTIGSISGGAMLPIELMRMIDELGDELCSEHRDAARESARRALEKGHEEAEHIRDQADAMATGAWIGAGLTAAGAGLQAYGALNMNVDASQVERTRAQAWVSTGSTTAQLGDGLNGVAQSIGKYQEADARRAAADAQAASQRADSEQAEAAEARKVVDRAMDSYGQIITLEHDSNMAAIGGRA